MGEQIGEPGPAMHLGQQAGDAGIGDHAVEPSREVFGRLGRDRLERRDLHVTVLDRDILQCIRGGLGRHV